MRNTHFDGTTRRRTLAMALVTASAMAACTETSAPLEITAPEASTSVGGGEYAHSEVERRLDGTYLIRAFSWADFGWARTTTRVKAHWGPVTSCGETLPQRGLDYYADTQTSGASPTAHPGALVEIVVPASDLGSGKHRVYATAEHVYLTAGGYGAYAADATQGKTIHTSASNCYPPSGYTPLTTLNLNGCQQAECNYTQTIWQCEQILHTAQANGSHVKYLWQNGSTAQTDTLQVCPYSTGENVYRQAWVVVTDSIANTSLSRIINWTFVDGNRATCPECY
jgi:hypothetical protein